jgi:predicted RNA-binding Zn-ribbon protein involved in translation (DUF1610 family)
MGVDYDIDTGHTTFTCDECGDLIANQAPILCDKCRVIALKRLAQTVEQKEME